MSGESSLQDRPRQEASDLQPRIVLLCIAGVVVMLVLAAAVALLVHQFSGPTRNSPENLQVARETRLESNPVEQRSTFEHAKSARLNSYGWVDPQHQVAHIPVEVAMRKLAARNATGRSSP
jgi:hypothetical protein